MNKKKNLILWGVITLLLVLSSATIAFAEGEISLKALSLVKVSFINDKGEQEFKLINASEAKVTPGEVVIFRIEYTNISEVEVDNVVITDPIPEHTIYKYNTAEGENTDITFSVDQGKSYDIPDNLYVTNKEGKKVPASVSDYTNIKWKLNTSIKPGQEGAVSFMALIK